MKIFELVNIINELTVDTIVKCQDIDAKYILVKDNTGKGKHFRRIKEGKQIPKFQGLIYSNYDFAIVYKPIEKFDEEISGHDINYVFKWEDNEKLIVKKVNEIIEFINKEHKKK